MNELDTTQREQLQLPQLLQTIDPAGEYELMRSDALGQGIQLCDIIYKDQIVGSLQLTELPGQKLVSFDVGIYPDFSGHNHALNVLQRIATILNAKGYGLITAGMMNEKSCSYWDHMVEKGAAKRVQVTEGDFQYQVLPAPLATDPAAP